MSDSAESFPPSYFGVWACLIASLIVLPAVFVFLCRRMRRLPNPPYLPYFCIFGTVGGYLLIAALSPSLFTLLIFPLAICAPIALAISLVYLMRACPFSNFHGCALVGCACLLAPYAFVLYTWVTRPHLALH